MTQLVFLSGQPGAGKSTLAAALSRVFGLDVLNVGDLLAGHLRESGWEVRCRAEIGPVFLQHFTRNELFELIRNRVGGGSCIVDGIRLADTCSRVRDQYPGALLWLICADKELRMQRLGSRKDCRCGIPQAQHLELLTQYEAEEDRIRRLADDIVLNNGSLDDFLTAAIQSFAEKMHTRANHQEDHKL
jgi:dephospho-CoA kinase